MPQFELDGRPVRSSDIRAAIAAGDLREAERLLGRPMSVVGRVARSDRSSTDLGFAMPVALPPAGRYEAIVRSTSGALRHRTLEVVDGRVTLRPPLLTSRGSRIDIELRRNAG